jgi:hypothetical protein
LLKIDGAVTLSFYQGKKFGDKEQIDYLFPLFPRRGLKDLFPSIEGRAEHYCAFALPEHGSITFYCNLNNSLKESCVDDDDEFVAMTEGNAIRVKAYYPILHTLRSFGSSFGFKDTDLATCPSVRKVFDSFLFMSERIDWWGKHGVLRVPENDAAEQQQQPPRTHRIDASMFRKEISCLRIEASFVLNVPNRKLDSKAVTASMERLLGRDLNVLFGHGGTDNILMRTLDFMSVNDWLQQVREVREMLTRKVGDEGKVSFLLKPGWRIITSRAKQQAECLQSLLGYCCRRTNQTVRSRHSWGVVWNANAEQEYPGMWGGVRTTRRYMVLLFH